MYGSEKVNDESYYACDTVLLSSEITNKGVIHSFRRSCIKGVELEMIS